LSISPLKKSYEKNLSGINGVFMYEQFRFRTNQKSGKAKTATTKPVAKKAEKPAAAPTKKDGTPDMRYKANKESAKAKTGPTKKDGTPDMRYKANKKDPKKKG
jgi:hypothetical protein